MHGGFSTGAMDYLLLCQAVSDAEKVTIVEVGQFLKLCFVEKVTRPR
jgi:hypothetical protein